MNNRFYIIIANVISACTMQAAFFEVDTRLTQNEITIDFKWEKPINFMRTRYEWGEPKELEVMGGTIHINEIGGNLILNIKDSKDRVYVLNKKEVDEFTNSFISKTYKEAIQKSVGPIDFSQAFEPIAGHHEIHSQDAMVSDQAFQALYALILKKIQPSGIAYGISDLSPEPTKSKGWRDTLQSYVARLNPYWKYALGGLGLAGMGYAYYKYYHK